MTFSSDSDSCDVTSESGSFGTSYAATSSRARFVRLGLCPKLNFGSFSAMNSSSPFLKEKVVLTVLMLVTS